MKKIVIRDGEVINEEYARKVRIVNIVKNKVLVAKYANLYMLPGGKMDKNETPIEALKEKY